MKEQAKKSDHSLVSATDLTSKRTVSSKLIINMFFYFRMALVPIGDSWNPGTFVTTNVRFADHCVLRVKSAVEMGSGDTMNDLKISIFEKLQIVAKARKIGE